MTRKSRTVSIDFAFFNQLWDFHTQNKGRIRQHYRELSKKYLDFNDPSNAKAFLRQPQFEALEMYVFLKEFLGNDPVHKLFKEWAEGEGRFQGRGVALEASSMQRGLFDSASTEQYEEVYKRMRSYARTYPNYIFALTMGTGKTILMATCIFYEFILANKFPKDPKYCHNALVFAPDRTVLEALREIQTFDKAHIIPPEYVNWLDSNIRFHFLDEAGTTLNTLDRSRFNLIVSNTQKIILKRQHREKSPMDLLLGVSAAPFETGSVYKQHSDLYGSDEPENEQELATNQRFEKLRRLGQLGIYVDEAHHAFGTDLAKDMGLESSKTSLRVTIDLLAASLERVNTHVVACYNYTGTPYVENQILPEVVYTFGLQDAINKGYLKKVRINGYTNPRSTEFVRLAIADFLKNNDLNTRYEGMLPKIAFFAGTIDELNDDLRPAVEEALLEHGVSTDRILVNVGDPKLTTNEDIREFNRLDTPGSEKQFILLVNKGREGWNCRSLFGVALYRRPKSKIFVLQASMRCLRAIGDTQHTGHVYLSDENIQILEDELQQNFRVSIDDMQKSGQDREVIRVYVKTPVEKIKLQRVRRLFQLREKTPLKNLSLKLAEAPTDHYRLLHTVREGLAENSQKSHPEDISHLRRRRTFSALSLVAEVSRYLNRSCLEIEDILVDTAEGMETILERVNEFNELLYDCVIPSLFNELYQIEEFEKKEEYQVDLVKIPESGFYELSSRSDLIVREADAAGNASKSFHLDAYCFDSDPERQLFWGLLRDGRVTKVFFTGMLTHGQSDFFVQYIDPESHSIRSYYPDFLVLKDDQTYIMVEVKADYQVDEPVVRAKREFAEQTAGASGMTYRLIKGTDAAAGRFEQILNPDAVISEQRLFS